MHLLPEEPLDLEEPPAPRELDPQVFAALLHWLDPDREVAARSYEGLRTRLIRLFAWRGADAPEELADLTLDRVALKVSAGLELAVGDPVRYVCGVAFLVFKEVLRKSERQREKQQQYAFERNRLAPADETASDDRPLLCLNHCLATLTPQDKALILRYHEGSDGRRIPRRKALAEELGLPLNALRIRAHRLRQRLEQCTRQCLARNLDGGPRRGGNS